MFQLRCWDISVMLNVITKANQTFTLLPVGAPQNNENDITNVSIFYM